MRFKRTPKNQAKREVELGKQHPRTRLQVNAYIRRFRGLNPELVKGEGYFYFVSLVPRESSVYVNSVSDMSFVSWLAQYDMLTAMSAEERTRG